MTDPEIELQKENEDLKIRLAEAEDTLEAIRSGEVDAIVVSGKDGEKIFSLTSAETPYRIIIEEMEEGAVTLGTDGIILYCNRRFASMAGLSADQIIGHRLSMFINENDHEKYQELTHEGGYKRSTGEISILTPDGSHQFCLFTINPLPPGNLGDFFILISNITELKNYQEHLADLVRKRTIELEIANRSLEEDIGQRVIAEAALAESEKKYRELVKYARAGIYEIDFRTKKIVTVNDAMTVLSGYSREELLTMDPLAILEHESRLSYQSRIDLVLKGITPDENIEYKVRAKDGHIIYALLNTNFKFDDNGMPTGATVVGHDITDRKKAEEELRVAYEDLELFNKAMIGRELRMIELKKEINDLCRKSGLPSRYIVESEEVES